MLLLQQEPPRHRQSIRASTFIEKQFLDPFYSFINLVPEWRRDQGGGGKKVFQVFARYLRSTSLLDDDALASWVALMRVGCKVPLEIAPLRRCFMGTTDTELALHYAERVPRCWLVLRDPSGRVSHKKEFPPMPFPCLW
jgi:hypothetical protein